jgi:hypothetical protein
VQHLLIVTVNVASVGEVRKRSVSFAFVYVSCTLITIMARPRKKLIEKRSVDVVLHLTPAEKKRLDAAAARAGLPVATVARLYTMRAVESQAAP